MKNQWKEKESNSWIIPRIAGLWRLTTWTLPLLIKDTFFMTLYVALLLKGFLPMLSFYRSTNRVVAPYKLEPTSRNYMDIYPPDINNNTFTTSLKPVLLVFPGGAFLIGYRMWAALIAKILQPTGNVVVMSADYRNFPWGSVPDMMQDVDDAIQFVLQNCHRYGGDASKVVILGQSAGAHLGIMALLKRQCKVAGFIGLSGIYNLAEAVPLFHKHGLGPHFVKEQLFGGQSQNSDPTQRLNERGAHELPPIQLWHGTQDQTIQYQSSQDFYTLLCRLGKTDVQFHAYPQWSHTDALVEAILEGNYAFLVDVGCCMEAWCDIELSIPPSGPILCPPFLIRLARKVCPF